MKRPRAPFVLLAFCALALTLPPATAGPRAQQLAINTPASSYAPLEQEIVREINLARTRPAEYAAYVAQFRPHYKGRELRLPGKTALVTEEGVGALEEAVRVLSSVKPVPALEVSQGMCSGAKALAAEQASSGATGHKGADGSFCEQRVERFGAWAAPIGENLSYGDETARERVISFLIDDGFANRNHRNRLLSPTFKVVGVACGGHKLGAVCVITLAGGFTQKPSAGEPQPDSKNKSKKKSKNKDGPRGL
ncbi:MAG TPA: CAP domain-containing protein [Pyrinomonadaceae bacterium]|nr:CAP domain-containing protein [Pyrinomonadaceae bacterium]